jgi:hypothetical protein
MGNILGIKSTIQLNRHKIAFILFDSRSQLSEVSPEAQDDITARKLWLLSEKWTQYKYEK